MVRTFFLILLSFIYKFAILYLSNIWKCIQYSYFFSNIRVSRSKDQNRNSVNNDDTVHNSILDDYPESLNPFASECNLKNDTQYPYELNPFEDENTIVNDNIPLCATENPTEPSSTNRHYSENSSVETVANNLTKVRKYRKKYPAPKPPKSACHAERELKNVINSPKQESDYKEEQQSKQSLQKTRELSPPVPKQLNNLDTISCASESFSMQPQHQENNENQICNSKVQHLGASMNQSLEKSISKAQKSLSENDISSKKQESCIKTSLLQSLQRSNSTPELINEIKIINATLSEGKKQFKDIEKSIKQKALSVPVSSLLNEATRNIKKISPVPPILVKSSQETIAKLHRKAPLPPTVKISTQQLTVSSLPQEETTENIKMKTYVLPVPAKSSPETIVKVHRKAPLPPTLQISHQQFAVSSLPQQQTTEKIKMETSVLPISVKSSQKTTEKVHRKAPLPPTVQISNVKVTQTPKKTRTCKVRKFFTNIFMKN